MAAKVLGAAALGGVLLLAACGGGGGSDGGGGTPTPSMANGGTTSGQLDGTQAQVKGVLDKFAAAAAGTPLAGVVKCGGDLANQDSLDFADIVLAGIPTGGTTSVPDPQALANSLVSSASDLTGLFSALSATGTGIPTNCLTNSVSLTDIQAAFAGLDTSSLTPAQLSSLTDVQTALEDIVTTLGVGAPTPSAATVTALATQLSDAFTGFTSLSPSTFPGLDTLTSVADSFSNVSSLLSVPGTMNPTSAIQSLISTSLLSSLTQVVPVDSLGGIGGLSPTTVITQITNQAGVLSSLFGAGLPGASPAQLAGVTGLFGNLGAAGPASRLTSALNFLGTASGPGTASCVFAGLPIPGSSAICTLLP